MKIKSVKLHPFAGIQDKEINFSDGLNLMIGPNEAGKSTMFSAINHGLLTSTNLTTVKFEKTMDPFLPVGGDVIRVTFSIYEDDRESYYTIQKTWKPGLRNGEAMLITPEGTEITDEDTVQQTIESLLPASPSTIREVMLSRQSELHQLMQNMENHAEVQQELSDVLRQNVMEAGGMSVDKFREKVDSEYDKYFGRWNREKQHPEDDNGRDRGVQHQWKQGVGKVLKAWYGKEAAEKCYGEIVAYERELDELNSTLETNNSGISNKESKYEALSPIREGLQQREVQQSQLDAIEEKFGRIKEISKKWPIYEDKIENIAPKLEKLNKQVKALNEEQGKAAKKSEVENLKKRVKKLRELKGKIEQAKKDQEDVKKVTQDDIDQLRALKSTIHDLHTTIRASKLKLSLTAISDTRVTISDAEGEKKTHELGQGSEISEEKEGFITLETDELQLTVKSATDNLDSVLEELEQKENLFAGRLDELEIESFEDAVSQNKLYQNYIRQLKQLTQQFKDELDGDEYQDLKDKLEESGDLEAVRDIGKVQEERDQVQEEQRKLQNELENMSKALEEWKEEFDGGIDNVFAKRAELTSSKNEIKDKLEDLPELPDDFDSLERFNIYLNSLSKSIEELKEQKADLREQLAELNGGAPDQTSDEYKEIVEDSNSKFESINIKAESIARVKEETNRILEGLEEETYQPLVASFTKWLGEMSAGRFANVIQENELPSAFVTSDDKSLPFDKLSHGTKDLAALAWKLTATEYFLSDHPGMILLDDPMVDMDADRQKCAAEALQKFSEEHQVFIFTCHSYYQDVLEAENLIELN